jgi:hypothetical protein
MPAENSTKQNQAQVWRVLGEFQKPASFAALISPAGGLDRSTDWGPP